jgi:triosephosphate isomerase (TIM)
MRSYVVAGNWKMNKDAQTGSALLAELKIGLGGKKLSSRVRVVICPPFLLLPHAAGVLSGTDILVGAQNMHHAADGAFTGEISATMLKSADCACVILGHSERRQYFHETDELVNRKARTALQTGLQPIICVGETLEERESGKMELVITTQIRGVLAGFSREELEASIIAYEPVWAIGTGKTAAPAQAQEAHALIRSLIAGIHGGDSASKIAILYGGSVKPDNAFELFSQPDVDGGLIGGASISAEQFAFIVDAADKASRA